MLSRHCFYLLALLVAVATCASSRAQEPGTAEAGPPPGVDKYYWDLSQLKEAKDRPLKIMADRYLILIKVQEWADQSGKFKTVARYVKHDPDMKMVTIESVKGRGAERTTKEVTVQVDKLSKTCQSRVKQIDTMQKKIAEVAAKDHPRTPGADAGSGAPAALVAGPEGAPPGVGPEAPAAPVGPDPSASEPDPLGFAEVPPPAAVAPPQP